MNPNYTVHDTPNWQENFFPHNAPWFQEDIKQLDRQERFIISPPIQ